MSTTLGTTTLRIVDSTTGVDLLDLNTASTIAGYLTSLDVGFPDVREAVVPLAAAHGMSDSTQYVGARAITAEVALPQRPNADAAADALAQMLNPGLRVWLYVQRPDWAGERRILARGSGFTCPPGFNREAQCVWTAPAGIFEDSTAQTVTINPGDTASTGYTFPVTYPRTYGTGAAIGAATVTVGGTMPALPLVDFYGPCTNPYIQLVSTGQTVGFLGVTVAAGSFLRVNFDPAAYTALMNNDPNQNFYSELDFANTDWFTLAPGSQQLIFAPNTSGAGCEAVVSWRNRTL